MTCTPETPCEVCQQAQALCDGFIDDCQGKDNEAIFLALCALLGRVVAYTDGDIDRACDTMIEAFDETVRLDAEGSTFH